MVVKRHLNLRGVEKVAGEVLWSGVRDGEVDQGDGLSGILLGPGEVVGLGILRSK